MAEDSQDELINKNAALGRTRRPSLADLLSDAEESGGDSNSGATSEEEEEDGTDEGETEEEEEEEGGDEDVEGDSGSEEDDEDYGPEDEAPREGSAAVPRGKQGAGGGGDGGGGDPLSSDGDEAESCPICLNGFRGQAVGTPESCAHYFCLDCIAEWAKNANSCPVDRITFKCICIRSCFGGEVLKKVPVEKAKGPDGEEEEEGAEGLEDPTFCEVCGRSDREDRLLLCDGCDAGYHMECLSPALSEVPVDEWFCPECAAPAPAAERVSEEEPSSLLGEAVPVPGRLRANAGRTRAIARTRQSERVRATVNRNRLTTARTIQHVPGYLMSSLLDETIEAVAAGLSTAVYQRPLTPRTPGKRKRKMGRRKKKSGKKKTPAKSAAGSQGPGSRIKRRKSRRKRRKGRKTIRVRSSATTRSRIARTLGLGKVGRGLPLPTLSRPVQPSLGLMRADIGAASLSLFGDPDALDDYDSNEEPPAPPGSPLSAKRRLLSQSALRSHQPVARPVSMGVSRRGVPASAPERAAEAAPVPDLLGSILSGQSLLMMSGADVVINRDGSLSAKKAAPVSLQRSWAGDWRGAGRPGPPPRTGSTDPAASGPAPDPAHRLGLNSHTRPPPNMFAASSSSSSSAATTSSSASSSSSSSSSSFSTAAAATSSSSSASFASAGAGGAEKGGAPPPPWPSRPAVKLEFSMTPRSVQNSTGAPRPRLRPAAQWNGEDGLPPPGATWSGRGGAGQPPARPPAPRADISDLPRIPKIKREGGDGDGPPGPEPAAGNSRGVDGPAPCINRLTGREGSGRGGGAQGGPGPREPGGPKPPAGGGAPSSSSSSSSSSGGPAPPGPARGGRGLGPPFESFRINIPGHAAPAGRPAHPGFCNTFRPVERRAQRKEPASALFSLAKSKQQVKSEMYDPFEPTGSDSSSPAGSPDRPGPGPRPSGITRTISVQSPEPPAFHTVRCVTSYTLGGEADDEDDAGGGGGGPAGPAPPPADPFFDAGGRTVTCVTVGPAPSPPASPAPLPPAAVHRIVELRSPPPSRSRSRSDSSSRSGKRAERKAAAGRGRSRSRSRSREGSSRSTSRSAGEGRPRGARARPQAHPSSSDGSGSRERGPRKKAKDQGRERRRAPRPRDRRPPRSRSRSGSPDGSAHEPAEGRRKKRRRRSGSRPRGREGSRSSSPERGRRHGRRRERSRERRPRRDGGPRARERRASRSPAGGRPAAGPRAREKRPHSRSRSRSRDRKRAGKEEASPPPPEKEPGPAVTDAARPEPPATGETAAAAVPAAAPAEDLDYGDTVEADHVFEELSGEAGLFQLDDMSSPPSPDPTDSSPEREPLPGPPFPAGPPGPLNPPAGPGETAPAPQEAGPVGWAQAPAAPGSSGNSAGGGAEEDGGPAPAERPGGGPKPEGAACPLAPLLKSKAPVKRVTWNLQQQEDDAAAPRLPFYRLPRLKEGFWKAEDSGLLPLDQVHLARPPPTNSIVPEPFFPDPDSSQVYNPTVPLPPTLPSNLPPYAPVSQPTVQFIMQGSLPLLGGYGAGPSLTPDPGPLEPGAPAAASEPGTQAAASTGDQAAEDKAPPPKPALEKTKNEEYLKKLHVQERAVEEVKLAIKPFYQKREITKDEYKDILRKAVQKICHSKSGEINPMKVANLVKAYVEKYQHMRRQRKAGPEDEPPEVEN
ncbi:PHD and RING finger domain-containing protein 1 [Tachyglossus aculeatus]|uniref:PHD and RING finger domain-containing protein 1 n=1 Tax=Tachyglossus aculeatus TaxID=9261 RepID=UPI0018F48950|nr:PHD and RING finger domain-containing protein 1 [Tachyglossus aculeatus]